MRRIKKHLAMGVLLLFIVFMVFLLTPWGVRVGLYFVGLALPGTLDYGPVSGRLISSFRISHLSYSDQRMDVSARALTVAWSPWVLWHGEWRIRRFMAEQVHLLWHGMDQRKQSSVVQSKPSMVAQFSHVHLEQGVLHHVLVETPVRRMPVLVDELRFTGGITDRHLSINVKGAVSAPMPLNLALGVEGSIDHYTLNARLFNPSILWRAQGMGDRQGLSLQFNEPDTLGGHLLLKASFAWFPVWQWQVRLNAAALNFRRIKPDWPSSLTLSLISRGRFTSLSETRFVFKTELVTSGGQIKLMAARNHNLHVKWGFNMSDLSSLSTLFKGRLQSQGEWISNAGLYQFHGDLKAAHFSLLKYAADGLSARWALSSKQYSFFTLKARRLSSAIGQWAHLWVELKGKTQRHWINVIAEAVGYRLSFSARGHLQDAQWRGRLNTMEVTDRRSGRWRLDRPVPLLVSSLQWQLDRFCLHSDDGKGRLCLSGFKDAKRFWQWHLDAQHFNLSMITHFISSSLALDIPTDLQAVWSGSGRYIRVAQADLRWHQGRIYDAMAHGRYFESPLQAGSLHMRLSGEDLKTTAQLSFSKKNALAFYGKLLHFSHWLEDSNLVQIRSKIKARFEDLSLFDTVSNHFAKLAGRLSLAFSLLGPVKNPSLLGHLSLDAGSIYLPSFKITLNQITADITSSHPNVFNYKITGYSQDKPVHFFGTAVKTSHTLKSTTWIQGDSVLMMDTPEYKVYASPQLKVVMEDRVLCLTGQINITRGLIQPTDFSNVVTLPTNQVVYTAGEPIGNESTWQIFSKVKVALGQDVRVNISGFKVNITGQATIMGHPKKTTLANGRINITRGIYSAYGRTLTIAPGSYIQFLKSPVNNPQFNVRAIKQISVTRFGSGVTLGGNDFIVGIELHGSFRHPKVLFFSVPSTLSQADILSYLVLGASSEKTGPADADTLIEAASRLAGKGAGIGGAVSEIKQGLGLSELGVESETVLNAVGMPTDQRAAFVVGKRLTKKLYLRYSVGLGQGPFVPVNLFQLHYTFDDHWSVQTNSSTLGNGGDILYTIQH